MRFPVGRRVTDGNAGAPASLFRRGNRILLASPFTRPRGQLGRSAPILVLRSGSYRQRQRSDGGEHLYLLLGRNRRNLHGW